MAEREYQRLTRSRSRSAFGLVSTARSSLWLAKDHLLCVDTTGYNEAYKRFYFGDIQAVVLRQTNDHIILGVLLGILTLGMALLAILPRSVIMASIFSPIAVLFLVFFILNLVAGPSCRAHLRTAVQTEELPSLDRLRRAHKVLNRLHPFIAQAQGQLTPEEVSARMQGLSGPTSAPAASTTNVQPAPAPEDPNAPPIITG
jgi:hypothetical protein